MFLGALGPRSRVTSYLVFPYGRPEQCRLISPGMLTQPFVLRALVAPQAERILNLPMVIYVFFCEVLDLINGRI